MSLRNERPEKSGAKPTNCYSERRTMPKKSREEEEVCNWKSGRNAKERAVAEGVLPGRYAMRVSCSCIFYRLPKGADH